MKDLRIYFSPAETDLSDWFREAYGEERSRIIKEHLKKLRETGIGTKASADELIQLHFHDIGDDDKLWIANQRNTITISEVKLEMKNRLNFIKKLHPESFSEVTAKFEEKYPNLHKLVNL